MIPRQIAIAAVALLGLLPRPAAAAEVSVVQLEVFDNLSNLSIDVDTGLGFNLAPDGEIRCNYFLNGPIEDGDLDRLKALIKPFSDKSRDASQVPRVCLNSPGGSYPEGLAISKFFMEENVGTAVPAGAICYSACSLMFMGGSYPWKGELNRFLHVTGDVGFHAPYFTVKSDKPFNGAQISEAFSLGVAGIRELMSLGVGNKVQRFPPELMAEMLAKGKDEVFSIDTVGKAIRFRVHVYGAVPAPKIDTSSFCNACINMLYGASEDYGTGGSNDLCATEAGIDETPFPGGKRLISDLAPRGGQCAIDVEIKSGRTQSWMFVEADAGWRDGLELAHWYLRSPSTKLSSLHDRRPDTALITASGLAAEVPRPEADESRPVASILEDFIKAGYLGHGRANHVSEGALFAPEVEYYDKGRIPRDAVIADHAAYYAKWPKRTYEMIAGSLAFKVIDDATVEATFRYIFEVANASKRLGGTGLTTLTLQVRDGRLEIIKENGRVLSKN